MCAQGRAGTLPQDGRTPSPYRPTSRCCGHEAVVIREQQQPRQSQNRHWGLCSYSILGGLAACERIQTSHPAPTLPNGVLVVVSWGSGSCKELARGAGGSLGQSCPLAPRVLPTLLLPTLRSPRPLQQLPGTGAAASALPHSRARGETLPSAQPWSLPTAPLSHTQPARPRGCLGALRTLLPGWGPPPSRAAPWDPWLGPPSPRLPWPSTGRTPRLSRSQMNPAARGGVRKSH